MINTKYDLFEINEVKGNENKMLEEIKFIENDIKNIISKNESYYKDSALRFFANLGGVSQNFVNLAKKENISNNDYIELIKLYNLCKNSYQFFILRKNLIENNTNKPQELDFIDNNIMLIKLFEGFEDKKIISLGILPDDLVKNTIKDKSFKYQTGEKLEIDIVNLQGNFTEFILKNKIKFPKDSLIICKNNNIDTYLSYLIITGQLIIDTESENFVIEAIKKGVTKGVEIKSEVGKIIKKVKKKVEKDTYDKDEDSIFRNLISLKNIKLSQEFLYTRQKGIKKKMKNQ